MSKLSLGRSVLAAVGVLAAASVAFAEEYSLPGISCIGVGDNGEISYVGGNAANAHTSTDATFRCPVIRRAPDTSAVTGVVVYVNDQHASEGVECYVRSCDPLGASCDSGAPDTSSSTGDDTLILGDADGDTDGWAYLSCTVPEMDAGFSRVYGYRWND